MKSLKKLLSIASLVAVTLLATSCKEKAVGAYCNLIPANSFAIGSFNAEKIASDANLTDAQKDTFKKLGSMSGSNASQFNAFIKHSKSIDRSAPIYVFATEDLEFGLVAQLDNPSTFESMFDNLRDNLDLNVDVKGDGYRLASNDVVAIAYRDNSLIFMAKSPKEAYKGRVSGAALIDTTAVAEVVRDLLLGKAQSITLQERFKSFATHDSDISSIYVIDENYPLIKFPFKYTGTNFVDFESGYISMKSSILLSEEINSTLNSYYAKPTGKFDKYIPSDYIMYCSGAVTSDESVKAEFAEMVQELSDVLIAEMKSLTSDVVIDSQGKEFEDKMRVILADVIDNVLYSLNGETILTINSIPMIPEMVLMSDVKDTKILDYLLEQIPSSMVTKKSENQYVINVAIVNIEVGIKDNVLYITNSPSSYKAFTDGTALASNFSSTPFAKRLKGSYGGYDLRVDKLMSTQVVAMGLIKAGIAELPVASKIENIEIVSDKVTEVDMRVNMKNRDVNALNIIMTDIADAIVLYGN